ncbi:Thiol-disulfide interchange protein, contains DsbC and DsbD domains [Cognatiyoonia koreensis]|uniref:Thiol-disulfide interchange protein, contains DsbC and DsbD domains n=1 Tax=Cognatiyoonia koreensis TaxID=364200 RepID=A0A1I0RE29_9RHOB|nr:protein-disulfide reductase DsbD domain-containing protein [Cognatiyoonia koreensis]SEW38857.1 Thiol-disulfide interchange protein, contains DsbC and DsbD domains [Cognatiyoonia koreensis]
MLKNLCLSIALACIAQSASAGPADDVVSVEVLSGWQTESGSQMAGLRIKLAPGWKTYWRAPGDAGIPPIISFLGSDNIANTRVQWPVPEVFYEQGMRSIGYYDEVVVPIELMPKTAGTPMTLSGEMQIGVCEEICVPAHLAFSAVIQPGGNRSPAIVAALIDRPLTEKEAGVTQAICSFAPAPNGVVVSTTLALPHTGGTEAVVIEAGDPHIWVSEPDVVRTGNQITATSRMVHSNGISFSLNRANIRITVLGANHAVDVRGCSAG